MYYVSFLVGRTVDFDLIRMKAMDAINRRFGRDTVMLGSPSIRPKWSLRREMLSPCYSTDWNELVRVG